jgi:hypothetical protein
MNDTEVRKVVYSLLQAGLVELIRPVGVPVQPLPSRIGLPADTSKEDQKSLINRIIRRIRSI